LGFESAQGLAQGNSKGGKRKREEISGTSVRKEKGIDRTRTFNKIHFLFLSEEKKSRKKRKRDH